jgi:hypothetical protein
MADLYLGLNPTSVMFRRKLVSSSTGQGLTGLSSSSAGLIISTIQDDEATATAYTQAAGNIETITTLGTYAAPTSGKCRFKEVDATNHPGVYEFQFADARFASCKKVIISVSGASGLLEADYEADCSLTLQENIPRVEWDTSGTTLTVRDQAGGSLYTKTLATSPSADAITGVS